MLLTPLLCLVGLVKENYLAAPKLTFLWSTQSLFDFFVVKGTHDRAAILELGHVRKSDGEKKDLPPPLDQDLAQTIEDFTSIGYKRGRPIIWSSKNLKVTLASSGMYLRSYESKTGRSVVGRISGDSDQVLGGIPDWGVFTIGYAKIDGMEAGVWSHLILPGLRFSSLPVGVVCDWSDNGYWQELALGITKNKSFPTFELSASSSPISPLVCGNPLTGKIRWERKEYRFGVFINNGNFVVAERQASEQTKYDILDAKDGRIILSDPPEFRDAYRIQGWRNRIYVLKYRQTGDNLTCYELTTV